MKIHSRSCGSKSFADDATTAIDDFGYLEKKTTSDMDVVDES